MDLSIIIVNWNSVEFLGAALTSIYREVNGLKFEVIVVDNASFDGSASLVAKEFPQVTFLQEPTNVGFSKSNNTGYEHSSGEVILFLNPDTEVLGRAVARMFEHLNADPRLGAVGCRVLNTDLTVQIKYLQAFPTLLNQALDTDVLQRRFPHWKLWGISAALYRGDDPQEVDVLAGSCIMVTRSVYEMAGRFSEDYFMYAEDVELCYRIRQAGYLIHYLPDVSIVHHGGSSSEVREESSFSTVMQRESLCTFFRKTHGKMYAALYRSSIAAIAAFRIVLMILILPLRVLRSSRTSPMAPIRKWIRVLRWAFGLETWARKAGTKPSNERHTSAAAV